jgi:hypothetical protein
MIGVAWQPRVGCSSTLYITGGGSGVEPVTQGPRLGRFAKPTGGAR